MRVTEHALTRLRERGLSLDWVREAILAPDAVEDDPAGGNRKRVFKRHPGTGRVIRIVYDEGEDGPVLVTAMPDRNRGRRMP